MYKIRRIQIYLIILLAFSLQVGALGRVEIFGAKPDLLLASVTFFGLFLGSGAGLESGLVAGILADIFAFDLLFVNALTLGLTGFLAGTVSNKFFKESKRADFALVAFFTIFSMSLHYILVLLFSKSLAIHFLEFFLGSVVPVCVYTALVSIPLYKLLGNIYNMKEADDYL